MGAKATRITSLSGTVDTMLACFVNLSRNRRRIGVCPRSRQQLDYILSSMNQVLQNYNRSIDSHSNANRCATQKNDRNEQVAESVSTGGAMVALAKKYNMKMRVLTADAHIFDNELTDNKEGCC